MQSARGAGAGQCVLVPAVFPAVGAYGQVADGAWGELVALYSGRACTGLGGGR